MVMRCERSRDDDRFGDAESGRLLDERWPQVSANDLRPRIGRMKAHLSVFSELGRVKFDNIARILNGQRPCDLEAILCEPLQL